MRREVGKAICDLQNGEALVMPLSRRMPSVGAVFLSSEFATEVESIVFFIASHLEAFSCFTHL